MSSASDFAAEPPLLRALVAGQHLVEQERYAAAARVLEAGLLTSAGSPPTAQCSAMRIELLLTLAQARIEGDRLTEGECALAEAGEAMQAWHEPAHPSHDAWIARAELLQARLSFWRRDFTRALASARGALQRLTLLQARGAVSAPMLVDAHLTLAANLSLNGEHAEAIRHNGMALALLDALGPHGLGRERGRALMNLANAEWSSGLHDEAQRHYLQALAALEGLCDAGDPGRAHDLGRANMNLAGLLTTRGDFDAAIAAYGVALRLYAQRIRNARRRRIDCRRFEASQAITRMNLGYTHFRAGRFEPAAAMFRLALRDYARIKAAAPQLEDDEARTWINQAHLLLANGQVERASQRYASGVKRFRTLLGAGRTHLEADFANARLGLARSLALRGRHAAAAAHAHGALHSYAALTHQGQLQHGAPWLDGWLGVVDALRASASPAATPRRVAAAAACVVTLTACLAQPPVRGQPIGADPLRAFSATLDRVAAWPPSTPGLPEFEALSSAFLRHLLDWVAQLLGDSDPAWLLAHGAGLLGTVERLRGLAQAHREGNALLADWFVSTRGLRAQREALVHSVDPQVQDFAAMLAQLRLVEEDLLGRTQPPAGPDGQLLRAAGTPAAAPASSAAAADRRSAEWRELSQRCEATRQRLTQQGLLPPRTQLRWTAVAELLADGTALCLLARPVPGRLVVVMLQRTANAAPAVWATELTLDEPLLRCRCDALLDLVRQSLAGAQPQRTLRRAFRNATAASDPPGPAGAIGLDRGSFAIASLQRIAAAAAQPVIEQVARLGLRELVLVPSDDLHCVPWRHLTSAVWPAGCRLLQYPSVGAWQRQQWAAPAPTHRLRWAMAACVAFDGVAALPWVQIEASLSRRLWQCSADEPVSLDAAHPSANGINALIGMGHGAIGAGGLAAAGLALCADVVLTAHDLPRIRTSRCLLLSCCVLGQTQDIFGEPLGFLSDSFGYGVAFGCGWLTEVPDDLACQFSLAFQFALREALRGAGSAAWSDVFESTRRQLQSGHWPHGFAAWLHGELPDHAPAPPSEALRRMMPWVIGLGR